MPPTSSVAARLHAKSGHVVTARNFRDLPASTTAHAPQGNLRGVRPRLYYVPRRSRFGPVPPDRLHVALSALGEVRYTPGGLAAANALGFTTQMPIGRADIVSTRGRRIRRRGLEGVRILERSPARAKLTNDENSFLELLRGIEHLSDLSPEETCMRAVELVRRGVVSLKRMLPAAWDEPPRVRAMLGALGEAAGIESDILGPYRKLINPGSRYDFGPLSHLTTARSWGAR